MAEFRDFIKSIQEKGNDGKAFEQFCKWFLKNDPYWSKQIENVWLWNDWPERWGADKGIDLIVKHKNGEIWAVQAKCYDKKYSIKKSDVDTFLSESNRLEISRRLLMASTNLIGKNALDTCNGQEKSVTFFLLRNFEEAKVEYPNDTIGLANIKRLKRPIPYSHQKKAIVDVELGFNSADKGQLIMACGTGKTFTTLWIKEKLKANNVMVLLPSLNLLAQTLREWTYASSIEFDVLCVCSDKSVGSRNEDSEDLRTSEASFSVTSDVVEIEKFLGREDPRVIFCTYQSSDLIAAAQRKKSVNKFDLVIADEAHRTAGKKGSTFSLILEKNQIRTEKKLFTTATPRLYADSIKKASSVMDLEVYGMDDEDVFGPEFHNLSFGEAISEGLLADYQVVVLGVNEPMIREWIDKEKLFFIDKDYEIDAKSLASKIGMLKAIKDYKMTKVISFHSRIKNAKDFSTELSNLFAVIESEYKPKGNIWSSHVSGLMNASERLHRIRKLKNLDSESIGLLTNARCLSEGVDVPSLDGVAFIEPKNSHVDIVQSIGRAIRKSRVSDKKKIGTIVIPVFIGNGEDAKEQLEASDFKPVWQVLKALRSHDKGIAEEIDNYRTSLAKGKSARLNTISSKIILNLPTNLDPSFSEGIRTLIVEGASASWNFWYGLLEQYYQENGHTRVLRDFKIGDFNLGAWVRTQRRLKEKLSKERTEKLDALGFIWSVLDDMWEEGFEYLKKYKGQFGDCLVPSKFVFEGFQLGNWVSNIRKNKKTRNRLSEENLKKMNSIGFVWEPFNEQWEVGFKCLLAYKKAYGDCLVPVGKNFFYLNFPLGNWVTNQRKKLIPGKLGPDREKRLNGIDFIWKPMEYETDKNIEILKRYIEKFGTIKVKKNQVFEGLSIQRWMADLRKRKENLTDEQIKSLNDLGFVWEYISSNLEEGLRHLERYYDQNGNCLINTEILFEGFKLGQFVRYLRQKPKALNTIIKKRLDKINFVWDYKEYQWELGYQKLIDYNKKHGDCLVPDNYIIDDFTLGHWVRFQRVAKSLSDEKKAKLNEIGFIWNVSNYIFDKAFYHLKAFIDKNGHCNVPYQYKVNNIAIYNWVRNLAKRKTTLSSSQLSKLDKIGFQWDPYDRQWSMMFMKLKRFKQTFGHTKVAKDYLVDGVNLGNWVRSQRKKRYQIKKERKDLLQSLGFLWEATK